MDIEQYCGLLAMFLGCFGYLLVKIDHMENKLDARDQRIDMLYQMFVDLLKGDMK